MSIIAHCQNCGKLFDQDNAVCPQCRVPPPEPGMAVLEIGEFLPDCKNCHALCCVALAFKWVHDEKLAGEPCKNLGDNFECTKWDTLEEEGYLECRSHTCYGAGQGVAEFLKEKNLPNWRDSEEGKRVELAVFQRVYSELYSDFNGRPPPVKVTSESGGSAEGPEHQA